MTVLNSFISLFILLLTPIVLTHEEASMGKGQKSGGGNHVYNYEELTCDQYGEVYRAIDQFIDNPNFPFAIQAIVRLAFHDCVGKACDGCLNPNDPNNRGVTTAGFFDPLNEIYDENGFRYVLSRADFFALAGHVALIRGVFNNKCRKNCDSLLLNYSWGRKDCPTSPVTTSIDGFPQAHGDFREVVRVFTGMFRLRTPEEIVALMGCHSLGGAQTRFSGFNFSWQNDITTFDNQYYKNLVSKGFIHVNVGNHSFAQHRLEFILPQKGNYPNMMLNTDFSILKNVIAEFSPKLGNFTGFLHCETNKGSIFINDIPNIVEECEEAPTASAVYEFADDLQKFYDVFTGAWAKMVSTGYPLSGEGSLQSPGGYGGKCGSCVPPGAYCAPGYTKSAACCKGYTCRRNICS